MRYLQAFLVLCCLISLAALSACSDSAPVPGRGPVGDIGPQLAPTPTGSPTPFLRHISPGQSSPEAGPVAAALPPAFPHYLSFGIINAPQAISALDEMRTANGTAFDFRYQRLSGSIDAQAVLKYMQDSARHRYIPAFILNRLVPSRLNDVAFMHDYYAGWETLLRQVKAYGKPVLVMVEPRLWEVLEQAGSSSDASQVTASVRSSGYSPAQYPDTAQGLAWTLLHMRDLYAGNAILAVPVSPVVGDADIATDQRPDLDIASMARDETHFLQSMGLAGNPAGVSSWDVLAGDLGGRDAAQQGTWWDRYDRTFPNFSRYLNFIGQVSQQTQRRVVLWQVPIGNQYYATMDNTPGHYQDNRAEYVLSHVVQLEDAGIVAVLFGSSDDAGTTNIDARLDGVTNASPVSDYQCDRCNTHISSYADDDGGYLRVSIGVYMAHPLPLL